MSDRIFLTGGLTAAAAILGAFFLYGQMSNRAMAADDGPGPNLVIEVAGQANGLVIVDLLPDVAPNHVKQIVAIAKSGGYDNVVFHRVIEGFMAQTGDVQYGKAGGDLSLAGTGASGMPDIAAEFSDLSFQRGMVGMARSALPDSANSQFFIMFAPGEFLDGEYTIVGHVIEGMEIVDQIKRGEAELNGAVTDEPDRMVRVIVEE